jgi:hypothetical protein
MTARDIDATFPNLRGNFVITSDPDEIYNCIAWAVNDTRQYWWPTSFRYPGLYWPPGAPKELTVAAFIKAFERVMFSRCDSREHEPGYDKVALYADEFGEPKHAARWWQEDGGWSSKLGEENDILHHTLEAIEGSDYGSVVQIMKRRRISPGVSE